MVATPPARQQSVEEIYDLLKKAVAARTPIAAIYNARRRFLCPHILGRSKDGSLHALCYQFGGGSHSGLQPKRSPDNWRCIRVDMLSEVELIEGRWRSPENHSRPQTCIANVEFDSENPDLSRWKAKATSA
jgi:hypothetical protein